MAARLQERDYHVITGAGSTWAEAFYYGMCILEEMQWIRTRPVHASDFFHGTLELVEPGVSVVLLKGEDDSRSLVERVEKFAPTVTDRVLVLDSADYDLPGIAPRVRSLVSPVVLAAVLERVSAHLAVRRDHPLTTRRYYKRVSY
jgi:fructoselysine-6-phosphate deglycase